MREDIIKTKQKKIEQLREAGMEPYPEKSQRSLTNAEALEKFDSLKETIFLVGRVRSLRPMGGSAFAHIEDGTGKIQLFLSKKKVGDKAYKLFIDTVEIGDFIEAQGTLFKTKKEEKTLDVAKWKMLSKNLRPIPTEHFGLKDKEELLRRRYLDLMVNPGTRDIFVKKRIFWHTIRHYLAKNGFLEVDTPALETVAGGADARPFITHHNALNRDLYLRISLELPLKRLLVGGYEKVFEIGKVFRNEGIDAQHLQDYLSAELYWAYADLEQGMKFMEQMYREVVKIILGNSVSKYGDYEIKWDGVWPKIDYFEEFKKETGIDLNDDISVEDLRRRAEKLGIKYEKAYGKGRMIDAIFKKTVRQKLIQPCFLVGHPIEVSPLAKTDPQNPKKVLRMQIMAGGCELGNGFSELNDPMEQRRRFEEQVILRQAGDEEAQMMDVDFVEALEYGMPPAFGFGLSERLFAFLMNKSVRETVIFPPVRGK